MKRGKNSSNGQLEKSITRHSLPSYRDHFLIHGERRNGVPGNASTGCIILGPDIRNQINASGDRDLIVTE